MRVYKDFIPWPFGQTNNPGKPGFVYLVEAAGVEFLYKMLKSNTKI